MTGRVSLRPALRQPHADGSRILPRAAKMKSSQAPAIFPGRLRAQHKRARAVAKESAELSGRAPRDQHAAVHIGGDHQHIARLPGTQKRLRHREGVEHAEARPSGIQRSAVLPHQQQ